MTLKSTLGTLRRFVISPRHRAELLARVRHPEDHFQGSTHTAEDRYPLLFEQARLHLDHLPSPRILSFGCSTGEEVFTLARYLPRAEITGVDINSWCLAQCAKKIAGTHTRFLHRNDGAFAEANAFDAIFALAVFQRSENRLAEEAFASGFTFARFEQELQLLDRKLNPGGLLFLDHCDFAFAETTLAAHYEALRFEGNARIRTRPLFGRDNARIAAEHKSIRAFRKRL